MGKSRLFCIALGGACLLWGWSSAIAVTVYSQQFADNNTGWNSGIDNGVSAQQIVDDFDLANSILVSRIEWYGGYHLGGTGIGEGDSVSFTIRIFNDISGSPAESPSAEMPVTVTAQGTDTTIFDMPNYFFSASLGRGLELQSGVYWLSILDTDILTTATFAWSQSDGTDYAVRFAENVQWNDISDVNLAYSIHTIPIPPALWLFGTGLLGLIGISRKRKVD